MYPPPHGPHGQPPYPSPPGAGILDAIVPTNPLAAVSCWVGILSMLLCGLGLVLGPVAVVTGILSLKRGALLQQSGYGKATSTARSWIGIVSGTLGTVVSLIFVVLSLLKRH
jgi:hypothetical protein